MLRSCAKYFLINPIISLKKRVINSWVIFSLREASQFIKSYRHFDNLDGTSKGGRFQKKIQKNANISLPDSHPSPFQVPVCTDVLIMLS